ncbi:MAG TPA: hypothetical protein VIH45_05725 [Desulfuromonadaceae bacterium]
MRRPPSPSPSPLSSSTPRLKRLHCLIVMLLSLGLHPCAGHAADSTPPAQTCDINRGPCSQKAGTAHITLDIAPKPVTAMKELTFTVTVAGIKEYEELRLKLNMPGMYMGTNEVRLVRSGNGRYTGKGVVPRCHSNKRLWSATVELPGQSPSETVFLFNVLY